MRKIISLFSFFILIADPFLNSSNFPARIIERKPKKRTFSYRLSNFERDTVLIKALQRSQRGRLLLILSSITGASATTYYIQNPKTFGDHLDILGGWLKNISAKLTKKDQKSDNSEPN